MSIKEQVKEILLNKGKIDNFYCIDTRLTTRLGAIINLLKNEGMEFDEEKSGYINGTKNWRYYLKNTTTLF